MARAALTMTHAGMATPARVAATAAYLDAVLRAACPSLEEGSVTLVVHNESMRAMIRPWNPEGRDAIASVRKLLDASPARALRIAGGARVAEALGQVSEPITGAVLSYGRGKSVVLDEETSRRMRDLARAARSPAELYGTTSVRSVVLRVGRTKDDARHRVRILFAGEVREVPLARGVDAAPFFDAAKSGQAVSVNLTTAWQRDADGRLQADPSRTYALSVTEMQRLMSGADFVGTVRNAAPDAFEDIDAIMEELGGWRNGTNQT